MRDKKRPGKCRPKLFYFNIWHPIVLIHQREWQSGKRSETLKKWEKETSHKTSKDLVPRDLTLFDGRKRTISTIGPPHWGGMTTKRKRTQAWSQPVKTRLRLFGINPSETILNSCFLISTIELNSTDLSNSTKLDFSKVAQALPLVSSILRHLLLYSSQLGWLSRGQQLISLLPSKNHTRPRVILVYELTRGRLK